MPSRTFRTAFIAAVLVMSADAVISLHAESPIAAPEVRRALPAWDTSLPAAQPSPSPQLPVRVMRALPVGTSTTTLPTSFPSPFLSGTPERVLPSPSTSTGLKATPAPSYPVTPVPDPQGSIRLAPSGMRDPESLASAQLAVADGFFTRKQPESAVPEYEKFLIMATKTSPGRERALFRLGESQRLMGNTASAETTFQRLEGEYPNGMLAPVAAYRLGELREARGYLDGAAAAFDTAAKGAADPAIAQAALYHGALCLLRSGQGDEAGIRFKAVVSATNKAPDAGSTNGTQGNNPYRIPALLQLGDLATKKGNREEALSWYGMIISSPSAGESLGEALIKAAVLQSELGRKEEARKLFEKVMASKDSGHWGPVAALGAIRLAAEAGQEEAVLNLSMKALAGDAVNKPEILLLQANAERKLGRNGKALEDYDTIIREYPASQAAVSAPFQRLLALYANRSDSLVTEIDRYLLLTSHPADRARAQLLKAEETLRRGKYKEAAQYYHGIAVEDLPEASRTEIAYKEAWALIQANDRDSAVSALNRFLEKYPGDERASASLAQRALLKQQLHDFPGALADYSLLLERYPKGAERELALQQKALLLGQQQDNKGMCETFNLLLGDYPGSSAAPQAHYWLGWTSFENKDYETAIRELAKARTGDPRQFGERAGVRILLSHYYLDHPAETARESAALKPALIPPEVGRWLGLKAMSAGDPAKAEHFLSPLVKEGLPGAADPEIQGTLASALTRQGKFREAQVPAAACLKLAHDPASRARALLVTADIQRSMKNLQEASSMADEAMLLQPEGSINAEARILSGDLLLARQDYTGAAKAYMTAGVLCEDPVLTPKALSRAANAYRQAGNLSEAQKALEELHKRFPGAPVPSETKAGMIP